MKHKTFELYRVEATEWANLPYRDALELRIHYAELAKQYYKSLADVIGDKFRSESYIKLIEQVKDSQDAKHFNQVMLNEIEGLENAEHN